MIKKYKLLRVCTLFILVLLSLFLVSCRNGTKIDYSNMILVVYDGNGGYLRNKTETVKKILVEPNSKIPRYVDKIVEDPYTTPSLGLAQRLGYSLLGWYVEDQVEYSLDPTGTFIYLDEADGNGLFSLNENGDYALGYIEDAQGDAIIISVEEPYEDMDKTKIEYIYIFDEGYDGFYIYDSDNAKHAEIYAESKNIYDNTRSSYTFSEVEKFGSFMLYDDLSNDEKTLFKDLPLFKREYYLRDENEPSIDRYSFGSGYADLNSIMETSKDGEYVFINNMYELYDESNPLHVDEERFNIALKYEFKKTVTVPSPSYLERYIADIIYWDFTKDRVTQSIVLIAHWTKKCTVNFVEKSGRVTPFTTKKNPSNTGEVDLVEGETIGAPDRIPSYTGYTFVGWSKSEDSYDPWDFHTDVFPIGTNELMLYAYMFEGEYTRISAISDLVAVSKNLNGKYILTNNIDLEGREYKNASPLGMKIQNAIGAVITPFTGTFLSFGHSISNFTISVTNVRKAIEESPNNAIGALFPYVQNATIENVRLENVEIIINNNTPRGTDVVFDLGGAGLIGIALEGETIVTDCYVDVVFNKTSTTNILDCDVYVGDIIALGKEYITLSKTKSNINHAALAGITSGTLSIEKLN